jgi:two-component system nitrogen regulation response regulator NtrX
VDAQVLVVDDEQDIRFSLRGILEDEGCEVLEAESGEAALEILETATPDLVLLDIWLTGMDGLEVLTRIRERSRDLPVIMISGHGNIETAVAAVKKGATDFIEKPLSLEKVILCASQAIQLSAARQEIEALRTRIKVDQAADLTGASPAIAALRAQVEQVAPTDAWVLISGENGTGKEIVARSIHAQSGRAQRPLVAVNCAAIPEELIESELFGHVKGAFTGAEDSRPGRFELAHRGTLFLDEIGDMSLKTQAKILRILQEQKFERVGGRKTVTVDVRVIAASNKDLQEEMRQGRFREDLYYRLKVFPLHVPPLRERVEDIPLLIADFVAELARKNPNLPVSFSPAAVEALGRHPWPGNVRELKNFVERMMIVGRGREITPADLPPDLAGPAPAPAPAAGAAAVPPGPMDFKDVRGRWEAEFLAAKLKEFGGNISKLAEAIGLERSYLSRKLKGYGIGGEG